MFMNHFSSWTRIGNKTFLSLLGLVLFFATPKAGALSLVSTNLFDLPDGVALPGETWVACERAVVSGTLSNDLFVATQQAVLNGYFNMDLWTVAEDIAYHGQCAGHVRFAANALRFEGSAADNVFCAAATMDFTTNAQVRGDVTLAGDNVMFQGRLDGRLTIYAVRATLGGVIRGPVSIIANDIVVMPATIIEGDLEYLSNKELFLDSSVRLTGALRPKTISAAPPPKPTWTELLMVQAFFYMSALLAGLAWLYFLPTLSMSAVSAFRESMLRCFLIGLAALFCIPAIIAMFFVSLLGIPLALMLAATGASMLYMSKVITAYAIGLLLLRRSPNQPFQQNAFTVLSTGLICLYLPAVIPSVTFFIWLVATCTGFGALLLAMFRLRTRNRLLVTIAANQANEPAEKSAEEN